MNRAFRLFLLLALRMCFVRMLVGGLRMLLGGRRVFFALCVITLAVMLRSGAMGLRCMFMMFGSFIVFISGHRQNPFC
jgi:hypothetical protein